MNIFHLHKVPEVCAKYHCDKHVVKMILETAQMLSTAYQKHCGEDTNLYKPAYPKHPMTIWVGCLLYTSPSPRDGLLSRMPSSA